jgi:hypothetical protein
VEGMFKVKMKTSMAGNNFSYAYGDEIEVSKEIADAWEAAGIAEKVEETKPAKKVTTKKGDA